MSSVILLKIESLHVRTGQEKGLKLHTGEGIVHTGPLLATLDESAPMPANFGLLNVATRTIRLHWSVIVSMPLTADAFAQGMLTEKNSNPICVCFEEEGKVQEDDYGFHAEGPGTICPGSFFSGITIPNQSNSLFVAEPLKKPRPKLMHSLLAGKKVACIFSPESTLHLTLPKSFGGGKHQLHLTGGFYLVPIMTLK